MQRTTMRSNESCKYNLTLSLFQKTENSTLSYRILLVKRHHCDVPPPSDSLLLVASPSIVVDRSDRSAATAFSRNINI